MIIAAFSTTARTWKHTHIPLTDKDDVGYTHTHDETSLSHKARNNAVCSIFLVLGTLGLFLSELSVQNPCFHLYLVMET